MREHAGSTNGERHHHRKPAERNGTSPGPARVPAHCTHLPLFPPSTSRPSCHRTHPVYAAPLSRNLSRFVSLSSLSLRPSPRTPFYLPFPCDVTGTKSGIDPERPSRLRILPNATLYLLTVRKTYARSATSPDLPRTDTRAYAASFTRFDSLRRMSPRPRCLLTR